MQIKDHTCYQKRRFATPSFSTVEVFVQQDSFDRVLGVSLLIAQERRRSATEIFNMFLNRTTYMPIGQLVSHNAHVWLTKKKHV